MDKLNIDRLFRTHCDHKGFRKVPAQNPDPAVIAEIRKCARCGEITDHRLLYPPLPKGKIT